MLVSAFRLPHAETESHTRAIISLTNNALQSTQAARLSVDQVAAIHRPVLQLHNALATIDVLAVGINDSGFHDHLILGYIAAARAAREPRSQLARFVPSDRSDTVEQTSEALAFIANHAVAPQLQRCAGELFSTMTKLLEKLDPMPNDALTQRLIASKRKLNDAALALQVSRANAVVTTDASRPSLQLHTQNKAHQSIIQKQSAYTSAKEELHQIIAQPEVQGDRAVEILAGNPIAKTRDLLIQVVCKRSLVLQHRALASFFEGVQVKFEMLAPEE